MMTNWLVAKKDAAMVILTALAIVCVVVTATIAHISEVLVINLNNEPENHSRPT